MSTTVDSDLLEQARAVEDWKNDATLVEAALRALVKRYHDDEIDDAIRRGYEAHPIDEPDEWGDLASWLDAASKT